MSAQSPATIHQTTSSKHIGKLEIFLLQTLIFLIPSNLAYHVYTDSAYLNGRLVDYLLPKLYLSDIPIIILLVVYVFKNKISIIKSIKNSKYIFLLSLYLLIIGLVSSNPLASSWYSFKVIELMFLGIYLHRRYTFSRFISLITPPLTLSIFLQASLALYQYINQSSFFGYYFLGEPDLTSTTIVHAATPYGLKILPYGTTPHPNVLAGFLAIGLILIHLRTLHILKNKPKLSLNFILTGLSFIVLLLSRSLSALSGIIFAFLIFFNRKIIIRQKHNLLIQISIYITIFMSLLFFPFLYHTKILSDNPSFYERYELNQIAINQILSHPLFGVGSNLFIKHLPDYPLGHQQSYLLQPVHHGLLLITAETGLAGLLLISLCLVSWFKLIQATKHPISAFLPLACLFVILQLDHYPLTLQTGQLLLTFSLVLPTLKTT